ncbi:PREDICTED: putative V-set and immunoglobulin domain-containing-like protein IGHV4OR15-8, partial [Thamnophis sirtalis]|uniref:putative V-set and immunoglobulin domain-containing-like protein IGHV4OR15-8 n=1 Tax=Thamnophis sirtalis TaxID=35019 RepID=UPI0006B17820
KRKKKGKAIGFLASPLFVLLLICNVYQQLLSFFSQAVLSNLKLAESGPGVVRPGDVLNLVCKVTGASISVSNEWHWMRDSPEKGLEWVSAINVHSGNKWYAASLKNRATISADETRNEFYLQIESVTAADSSVYFCTRLCTMRQKLLGLC